MSIRLAGVTGEGHAALDAFGVVAVRYITVFVNTLPPKTRLVGTGAIPRGVRPIGEVGIGWFPDDPSGVDPAQLAEPFFVHLEAETKQIYQNQGGASYFGSAWWRLVTGANVDILVEW